MQRGDGMLGFHTYFGIRHNWGGRIVSYTHWPPCIPKEILWFSFLIGAELTPAILRAARRNRRPENLQGPNRDSNLQPPVLWRSALTNCAPVRPHTYLLHGAESFLRS